MSFQICSAVFQTIQTYEWDGWGFFSWHFWFPVFMFVLYACSTQREQSRLKRTEGLQPPSVSPEFRDRELERHITPLTLKPKIKQNPLYMEIQTVEEEENHRAKPSWTIEDYDRHCMHTSLSDYLKVQSHSI